MTRPSCQIAGHLGEFLQGRLGPEGPVVLVTLPCPALMARARWQPAPGFALHAPRPAAISQGAAAHLIRLLGQAPRGRFILAADMPAGGGAGGSTAVRLAIAGIVAPGADAAQRAQACLRTEGATDPLMFPDPARLLWASRIGQRIAALPPLPRMEVLGGFYGPPRRTNAAETRFADIADLVAAWPAACTRIEDVAHLATQSALRNQALHGPGDDPTGALALALGAAGWSAAHTGSARALIFAPGRVPDGARHALRAAGFTGLVRYKIGGARC